MPMTRTMLKEMAGFPPDTGINPVTAVALGAATYSHILETGQGPRTLLHAEESAPAPTVDRPVPALETTVVSASVPAVHFVTAHGVGVKAKKGAGWANVVLIPKNTRVPCSVSRRFYTNKKPNASATRIRIDVTQGDTENLELAEFLGTATIAGLPPNEPTGQPVKITMRFDDQGRLHLHAIYINTGQDLALALEIPGGLKEAEVEQYRQLMAETGLISQSSVKVEPDAIPLLEEDDGDDEILTLEPW
jgi:molecular chaperone DnaK (HSP70)